MTAGAGDGEGRGREMTGFIATLLLLATASTSTSSSSSLNSMSSSATTDGGGGDRKKDDDANDDERTKTNTSSSSSSSSCLDSQGRFDSRRLFLLGDYLMNACNSFIITTITSTTTAMNTTMCEEASTKNKNNHQNDERIKPIVDPKELKEQQQRYYRRRMTNVGRFSLVSETVRNPSVPVLVLAMTGKPWKSDDFRRLYQQRNVAEKHPRFAARLDSTKTHFVFDTQIQNRNNDTDKNKNNDNYRNRNRNRKIVVDNVRDVLFPAIPVAELKDRINDAALYEPLDLNTRLWEAWTATGGSIGQSGAITSTSIQQQQNEKDNKDVESLLLFRAHHCMADGVSLSALFGDLMDEGPEFQEKIKQKIQWFQQKKKRTPWWKRILFVWQYWMWGTLKAVTYQLYLFAVTWYERWISPHDDPWMILKSMYDDKQQQRKQRSSSQQQQQQQLPPPRTLSWATVAPVDEVKKVCDYYSRQQQQQQQQENGGKRSSSSSGITINDIFCSCVSAAIIKQLKYHRSVNPKISSSSPNTNVNTNVNNKQCLLQQLSLPYMNLIIPVHLQGGILLPGQSMGNKIGAMVSRIPGENLTTSNNDPTLVAQERLIQVHTVLNERKQTPIAVLSYLMAGFMGYLSPSSSTSISSGTNHNDTYSVGSSSSSWTPWFFSKAHANASVVVTNTRGPESCVHLEGRSIRALLGFLPLPAGVPVGVVVGSYNNEITLTVTAEEYAVPDADKFLCWVEDEYELLKRRAATGTGATDAKFTE